VIDALSTLAFEYPRRADYFREELENFLLLARDEGLDPLRLRGSYAGAMGMPQFMPRSFRHYAVDYDGDGRRDIWGSPADTVASIANYLREHGWREGGPIAVPASVRGEPPAGLLAGGYKPRDAVGALREAGVEPRDALADDLPARLLALDGDAGTEYWVALENFHVITAYNRSILYAMAIYQLSLELRPGPAATAP
jgi:membrane-bound lytic murein transglycosylase B